MCVCFRACLYHNVSVCIYMYICCVVILEVHSLLLLNVWREREREREVDGVCLELVERKCEQNVGENAMCSYLVFLFYCHFLFLG